MEETPIVSRSGKETLISSDCLSVDPAWNNELEEVPSFEKENRLCDDRKYRFADGCNNYSSDISGHVAFPSVDSMLCLPGSRLVSSGIRLMNLREDDIVMFVNVGGESLRGGDCNIEILRDTCFLGGDILRTEEKIIDGGDFPSLYQSARFGNFSYCFKNIDPGDYFVDLHFAEIINTYGPKGMRTFNVFCQEEMILSELDIYSIVGANKPLQLVGAMLSVTENQDLIIRFEDVRGSPIVSAICIRKAPTFLIKPEYHICKNCASKMESSPYENRNATRITNKYEKKVLELTSQCQIKSEECHEAWMALATANDQLHDLRMQLDTKMIQATTLEQAMEKQARTLTDISQSYDSDKKLWGSAINRLKERIRVMKIEYLQLLSESRECVSSIPALNKMVYAVQSLVAQCEDLKDKYNEEQMKRRILYNQLQEEKGNIRVFCRCRPLSKEEISNGANVTLDFDAAKDGEIAILTGGCMKKVFKFDKVYTPKDDQATVFADASSLVISVLDGYNVCIFAYGQTGTGKTFTMEGSENNRGVNYRTLEELFKISKARSDTFTYNISVCALEVYNEQIRDLLATSPAAKKLEIRQAPEGFHHVPGMVEARVESIMEAWDVLQVGSNARAVGSNHINERSSRSHCILCVQVKAKNLLNGECTKSKLWLVDLAGSERLTKTDAQGDRLKEAQNINRSLSALGDVISALAAKSSHIPYRNSKLTHLLQDSLGGDSKALMFVQVSPSENDIGETMSSLNFATRVRGIELGPAKKQIDSGEIQKMKLMMDRLRQECRLKDENIRKLEENNQNFESKVRSKDQFCRNQQEKIKQLENLLQSKLESQERSEKQQLEHIEKLKMSEEMCLSLQKKVNDLKEQHQKEALIFQQKVRELDNKVKEQNYEFQQKIRDLEIKLKQQEEVNATLQMNSSEQLRISSTDTTKNSNEDSMKGRELPILSISNSANRAISRGSLLLRGANSLHEIQRKREYRNGLIGEIEIENIVTPSSLSDRKILPFITPSESKDTTILILPKHGKD